MVPISPTIHWFELALCKATFLLLVVSSMPLLTTISSRHGNSEPRWFFVVQNLWSMNTSTLSHGMHHTICSDTIGCNYPLKFNIDTQSRHIWREIHFPNHHWYVKSWGVGLLVVQKVWSLTISEHPTPWELQLIPTSTPARHARASLDGHRWSYGSLLLLQTRERGMEGNYGKLWGVTGLGDVELT